ncbi:hypothetical protein JCM3770_004202, partial [Rhodotorula araucariae]
HSMCGDAALFANLRPCTPSPVGGISNQNGLKVTGVGTLLLRLASGRVVKLNGALLVPGISTTLISSAQLNVVLANGSRIGRGLYRLDGELAYPSPSVAGASALLAASSSQAELTTSHQRLAHLAPRSLKSLAKSGDVTGLDIVAAQAVGNETCNVCHVAHSSRLPFPHLSRSTSAPLELVHSDVLSANVPSLSGRRYVVTFTDDFSRMLWVEPLARKSDVLAAFMRFKPAAENESGHHLQRIGPITASNGVAERVNRSIVEGIISLLNQAGAPKDLWAEALQAFVFIKDRSMHAALLGRVPLATWRGRPVRVDMLRVRGSQGLAQRHGRSKLDDKAVPLVFIGYDGDIAAYQLLDPASHKIVRSRDARFVEHEFPLRESPTPSSGVPQQAVTPAFDLVISPGVVAAAAPEHQPHTPTPPAAAHAVPPAPARAQSELLFQTSPPARPHLERAAAPPLSPDSPDLIDFLDDPFGATLAQVEAMLAGTGDSLAAADDDFALPSSDPHNHRHKVRLVAQGFSQRPGIDFRETFEKVRLVAQVFSQRPGSIDDPALAGKVLKLDRALYGLKQAGRVWNHRIHESISARR